MKGSVSLLCLFLIAFTSCKKEEKHTDNAIVEVSNSTLERVEPPHWWIGFKNTKLQLLVKEDGISEAKPEISYSGVSIEKVSKGTSPNYLFIDVNIAEHTKAGKFDIVFTFENGTKKQHTYELKAREKSADAYVGFNSSDAVYLITPDRFANGDTSNDEFASLKEKKLNRKNDYSRHGGDITGITNHLDYINDMGFTAIWPTPVLINDMPESSYHGYAITDFYQVDSRFGTLEEYKNLSSEMKKKGMKLIMDQVANHCGLEHWWMKDLPFNDWVNNQKNYEDNIDNWTWEKNINSNHRRTTNQDLYASENDKKGFSEGWFVAAMPDLNQRNPFMAKYIIQNSIWWIETLQLGGIRQDTYPYPDKNFMSDWSGAIMEEYPNFSIVGEEWSLNPLLIRYWQKGADNKDGYESHLTSAMDFPMQSNIVQALKEKESWDKGLVKVYEGLANDFAYADPEKLMIFPDNHDMDRIFTQLNEDLTLTKMALSYMLTIPRVAQIYYGTEVLIQNTAKPHDHGLIRTDFPGGWEGDITNAFNGEGLNTDQKEMQSFLKKVLNHRKNSKAIHDGKTIHFAPFMNTYFLFRVTNDETVMLILNKNDKPITIDLKRYAEMDLSGKQLKNIVTGESIIWGDDIKLDKKGCLLLTTKL
ncbi:glycoside hydrolase family 13 protein [Tenacibaculum sp. IB213877]|uniref:glycoside hydrolase family 13 protein n=1 Tax=Tenacibaculum sp. IB213877 TaxID=3097351 RepID=UPI002A5A6466|nr:glycoside hydrolase family 13 protein [Tenacibaculum sp. IB213877]MDY0779490.1 glycoside hydrolase family 13 protein [Tenacibaculum sp. IB213877]